MSLHLRQILDRVSRPVYVKTAAEQPYYGDSYPVGTKEQVFLSCLRAFDAAPQQLPDLMKFAEFWNIEKDVETAIEQLKTASATIEPSDQHYALIQTFDGQPLRKFAAYDQESTVKAGQAFFEHRHRYPLEWRKQAAARLLAFGDAHSVRWPETVGRYLEKAAGLGFPSADSIRESTIERLNATPPKHRDLSLKFAKAMEELADSTAVRADDELVKIAIEIVAQYDGHVGLDKRYGDTVSLPEEMLQVLAADLRKEAAADHMVTLVNGQEVDASKIPTDVLLAVDDGLAKLALADLQEALPTLPRPDADTLVRLLA